MTASEGEAVAIPITSRIWGLLDCVLSPVYPGAGTAIDVEHRDGHTLLVITGLPDGAHSDLVLDLIAAQVNDGVLHGIRNISDESSDTVGLRCVITPRPGGGADELRGAVLRVVEQVRASTLGTADRIVALGTEQVLAQGSPEAPGQFLMRLPSVEWDFILGVIQRSEETGRDRFAGGELHQYAMSVVAPALGYTNE